MPKLNNELTDFALYVISQLSLSNVSGLRHLVNTPITTSSDADSHWRIHRSPTENSAPDFSTI